nr:hypothetical protein [Tanacetum cinerariifolium]
MLDQTFDRIQKLVSQLELLDEKLSQEAVNQKLLRSFHLNGTHMLLCGGRKLMFKHTKHGFMSSLNNNTSSTNRTVNTAQEVNTAHGVSTTSTHVNGAYSTNIDNLSDADICSFFASQPSSPQLVHEDLEQIHPNDINQDNKYKEISRKSVLVETTNSTALVSCDGLDRYDWSDQAEKEPNYALMAFSFSSSNQSKAFRVFNSRTRIVEENMYIRFSESTPNVQKHVIMHVKLEWRQNLSKITFCYHYGLLIHHFPKIQRAPMMMDPNLQVMMERRLTKIKEKNECNDQESKDNVNSTNNVNIASSTVNTAGINRVNVVGENISIERQFDPNMLALEDVSIFDVSRNDGEVADISNLDTTIQVSLILTTRIHKDHPLDQVIGDLQSATQTRKMLKNLEEQGFVSTIQQRKNHKDLQNCLFACFLSQEEPKKVFRNKKDERGIVIRNKARLVAQGYTQEEEIDYDEVFAPISRIEAIKLFLAYTSSKDFVVYQMDIKSAILYGKIEEKVYVCQLPGFEDPYLPDRVCKVKKALYGLHQALRAWVLDLEKTKTTQCNEIDNFKKRVKKLEKRNRSRTHKLKRLYKFDLTARVESSREEASLGEDASKQERMIDDIDVDTDVTLLNDDDNEMFDVDMLGGNEMFVEGHDKTVTTEEITLAKALKALKASKLKAKGIVFQDPEPALHEITLATPSSRLVPNSPPLTPFVPPSRHEWDLMFQPVFDEFFNSPPSVASLIHIEEAPALVESTGSPSLTTIDQNAPSPKSLKKYRMKSCDPVDTPMVEKSKLDEDPQGIAVDPTHYRGMVDTLIDILNICPKIQGQEFDEPPTEEEALSFIRKLDTQVYSGILPKAMINQGLLDSIAYKTYCAISSVAEPPKSRKSQKKSYSASLSEESPSNKKSTKAKKVIATKPKLTKKKAPVKADKGKGLNVLSKGQEFDEPPTEEEALSFIRKLGHFEEIKYLVLTRLDFQEFKSYNRMYYKKNLNFVALIWEDLAYQIDNMDSKKHDKIFYHIFTKIIIHHFLDKDKPISIRNRTFMHTARDDSLLGTMRFVSIHADTQVYSGILPKAMINQGLLDSIAYKTYCVISSVAEPPKSRKSQKKSYSASLPEESPSKKKSTKAKKVIATKPKLTKKKAPVKADKGKGLNVLSEVALSEAAQLKEATKQRKKDFHISQAIGLY